MSGVRAKSSQKQLKSSSLKQPSCTDAKISDLNATEKNKMIKIIKELMNLKCKNEELVEEKDGLQVTIQSNMAYYEEQESEMQRRLFELMSQLKSTQMDLANLSSKYAMTLGLLKLYQQKIADIVPELRSSRQTISDRDEKIRSLTASLHQMEDLVVNQKSTIESFDSKMDSMCDRESFDFDAFQSLSHKVSQYDALFEESNQRCKLLEESNSILIMEVNLLKESLHEKEEECIQLQHRHFLNISDRKDLTEASDISIANAVKHPVQNPPLLMTKMFDVDISDNTIEEMSLPENLNQKSTEAVVAHVKKPSTRRVKKSMPTSHDLACAPEMEYSVTDAAAGRLNSKASAVSLSRKSKARQPLLDLSRKIGENQNSIPGENAHSLKIAKPVLNTESSMQIDENMPIQTNQSSNRSVVSSNENIATMSTISHNDSSMPAWPSACIPSESSTRADEMLRRSLSDFFPTSYTDAEEALDGLSDGGHETATVAFTPRRDGYEDVAPAHDDDDDDDDMMPVFRVNVVPKAKKHRRVNFTMDALTAVEAEARRRGASSSSLPRKKEEASDSRKLDGGKSIRSVRYAEGDGCSSDPNLPASRSNGTATKLAQKFSKNADKSSLLSTTPLQPQYQSEDAVNGSRSGSGSSGGGSDKSRRRVSAMAAAASVATSRELGRELGLLGTGYDDALFSLLQELE